MIALRCKINPELAPPYREQAEQGEGIAALKAVWPLPILIVGVLAGVTAGVFSPAEAGAVGAALAILVAWTSGGLTLSRLRASIFQTLCGTASVFIIVIATVLLARFMALSGVPGFLTEVFVSEATSTA